MTSNDELERQAVIASKQEQSDGETDLSHQR